MEVQRCTSTPIKGMSLVEVMVALALGLILLRPLFQLDLSIRQNQIIVTMFDHIQERGQFARRYMSQKVLGHGCPSEIQIFQYGSKPSFVQHATKRDSDGILLKGCRVMGKKFSDVALFVGPTSYSDSTGHAVSALYEVQKGGHAEIIIENVARLKACFRDAQYHCTKNNEDKRALHLNLLFYSSRPLPSKAPFRYTFEGRHIESHNKRFYQQWPIEINLTQ